MEFQKRIRQKKGKAKIVVLTAYDYQTARILDETNIDLILVGDSLGMVVQGHSNTKSVTMADMIYHVKTVAKGATNIPIIGDMPIHSCDTAEEGLRNAQQFLDAGAHGVKVEGNKPKTIEALNRAEIPVMGHVGMLPQMADTYRLKGKTAEEAKEIFEDALNLDRMNVFSIVLECIPEKLAERITGNVETPTIGIGAGKHCDGQVLVTNDMLGFNESFKPKFVKRYADLDKTIKHAVAKFIGEVSTGKYPDDKHTYH